MPPETSISGTVFAGRYKVVEELGRGGMGRVYRAYDNQLREEVALKIIKPEVATDKKALERFSNELKLARKIIHRNVCRMYELMEYQSARFISMEYVPGEDLKSFIKRARRLDIGAAVAIAIQVCEGLAEAHRLGVVHRDLKPGNIMIDKEGSAKIMDFGIARSLLEKGITGEGRVVGTPEYISPEQIEGKAADPQSDLYALGVILFEMVCGTYPFEGDTARIIAQKIQGKKPPNPKTINPHIPDDLAKVILKCLEKKERRYQSATDVLAELKKIENDLPTSERIKIKAKSSIFAGFTRQIQKRKILGTVVGLAVVALVVILIMHPWRSAPKGPAVPSKPTLAVLFFANRTGDAGLDIWKRSLCTIFIGKIRQLSKRLTVISESNIYSYLKKLDLENGEFTSEDLSKIAAMSRATYILTGKFMKLGESLQVNYELEDMASSATVGSGSKNGTQAELDATVADLAKKVLQEDLRIPAPGSARAMESSSTLAMQSYMEARDLEIRANLSRDKSERNRLFSQLFQKFQAAIEADPRFAQAYWGLGDYYQYRFVEARQLRIEFVGELIICFHQVEIIPLAGANAGLGWARFFEERLDEAYPFFTAAIQLDPENPEINVIVGSYLYSIGQIDSGIRYFTKAIESGDTSVSPYHHRARNYMDIGRLAEAVDDARTMIALEPGDVTLQLFYARILAKMKKIDEAERELARAEALDPASPDLLYIRAYLYTARGDKKHALPILEKARKENPFWFSYFLSENYSQLGMNDEAISVIQEGIKNGFSKVFSYLYPYQVLKSDYYEKLRSDPRFRAILESQKEKHNAQREKYRGLLLGQER
jgi:serine/threonine protein kinase/tetratricopeptide (TPR) repeat protein